LTEAIVKKPDDKDILARNPQLDPKRIAEHEAYLTRMVNAGVEMRTKYRVEPALSAVVKISRRR
jgi:hypothetical protein